jgi:nitrile hydratase subunit alpha
MSGEHSSLPIAARVRRLEDRLIQAGVLTDAQLDQTLERYLASASPLNGARLVARAWVDEAFKARLLDDARAALAELDLADRTSGGEQLRVVANSAERHNVVVCTLCSCYPTRLLGPSPSWYKSTAYRARVVREPRAVLAEFGLRLPPDVEVTVWDASADARYMVLPCRPAGTEGLAEADLARLVTRNGLIGTAAV